MDIHLFLQGSGPRKQPPFICTLARDIVGRDSIVLQNHLFDKQTSIWATSISLGLIGLLLKEFRRTTGKYVNKLHEAC